MTATTTSQATPYGAKIPTYVKAIYGLGDWGAASATTARSLFWAFFLVSVIGIPIELAGAAIVVGRIWDGINDPLIGILSDRLSTKWGRRRPLIMAGAIPFGVGFFLMFNAPPFEANWAITVYYILVFILYDTAFTLVNAPYAALTPEMTQDYDERSSLAGWRMGNSIFASLLTAALFKLLAENVFAGWFEGAKAVQRGYAVSAAIWGLVIIITPLLVVAVVREPTNYEEEEELNLLQILKDVWANKPFRIGALVYLLTFTAVDIITAIFVWFLIYYMQLGNGADSLVLAATLGMATLTMPITVMLMRRFGKKRTYFVLMSFWVVVQLGISAIAPGNLNLVLLLAALAGLGYGAANAIPWAIVADVIEEDEWNTGKRREGAYSAFLVTFRKFTSAMSIALVAFMLGRAGFIEPNGAIGQSPLDVTQPDSAINMLRIFMGVFPAILLICSMIAIRYYPLTKEAHAELRRKLEERRAQQALQTE